ncbi:carbohydrate ABC transporter permease [Paenibacillus sp. GCM10027626]|uniref:carbohydrate ABC transporter permease n=1 Tax=Paenibacillus sp. GCM10027626 TaxID=3273411 RepID=UPI003635A740
MHKLRLRSDGILGYTLIIPIIFLVFVIIGMPFFNALYLSFTDKVVGADPQFIGLNNYIEILSNSDYWKVLWNTFIYMIAGVGLKLLIGTILALVVNEKFFGRSVVRMLLLIPWALSGMVAAITWKWMYDDTYGIINSMLMSTGLIDLPIPWLSGTNIALVSVIIVNIWRGVPFFIFSILGGLQTIDHQMYEAARIDGASWLRQFWAITLPSIMPVIKVATLLSAIWTFNDFENIFLITGGGPLHASAVISTYTYEVAFMQRELGKALSVAGSVIPLLVIMIIFSTKKLHNDD